MIFQISLVICLVSIMVGIYYLMRAPRGLNSLADFGLGVLLVLVGICGAALASMLKVL